ncbi:MAG: hypothetical protein HXY20_04195 [Acidobacteria bacterium]|nr:hypothetical protein [Acidobacteriota bacterium]
MRRFWLGIILGTSLFFPVSFACAYAQEPVVVPEEELSRVVPTGFYYEGQVAPTQMRNAAAIRIREKKHVIVALVDNSGYSAEIREKIEGFWATDIPVRIGGRTLAVGVYPFGVTQEGVLNIYDLAGTLRFSVRTSRDTGLRNPRPLAMVAAGDGIRFYRGRNYVIVRFR